MNYFVKEDETMSLNLLEEKLLDALVATRLLKSQNLDSYQSSEDAQKRFFESNSVLEESMKQMSRPAFIGMLDSDLKNLNKIIFDEEIQKQIELGNYMIIREIFSIQEASLCEIHRQYIISKHNLTREYMDTLTFYSDGAYKLTKLLSASLPGVSQDELDDLNKRHNTFNQEMQECDSSDFYKRHDIIVKGMKSLFDYEKKYQVHINAINQVTEKNEGCKK